MMNNLFRGKQRENKEWLYGSLIQRKIGSFIVDESNRCAMRSCAEFDFSFDCKLVISETVGQFTGLIDKNGTKVFEGDILKGAWKTVLTIFYDEITLSYRVKTSAGYDREPSYYGIEKLEVIGNIYDNPELMKDEV